MLRNAAKNRYIIDRCGQCGGNNTCVGCDGFIGSGRQYDACGTCGGDDSLCTGCDGFPNSGFRSVPSRLDNLGIADGMSIALFFYLPAVFFSSFQTSATGSPAFRRRRAPPRRSTHTKKEKRPRRSAACVRRLRRVQRRRPDVRRLRRHGELGAHRRQVRRVRRHLALHRLRRLPLLGPSAMDPPFKKKQRRPSGSEGCAPRVEALVPTAVPRGIYP